MFTGLVEALGHVVAMENRGPQARLSLSIPFATELALGDSVAVNGCCLTVAEIDAAVVSFDLLRQTLDITALSDLVPESVVNLERAVQAHSRLGGHWVQGHIDAAVPLLDLSPVGQDHRLEIALPPPLWRYAVEKGSITVDGISLTIAELTPQSAIFWITPHTYAHTNLPHRLSGQMVNVEMDAMAKQITHYLDRLHAHNPLPPANTPSSALAR